MNAAYIEITNQCNLRCRSCYNSSGGQALIEISPENFREILAVLPNLDVNRILISGGEPLLHSRFDAYLNIIRENPQITFMLITNGTVPDSGFLAAYFECLNLELQVSLDGASEETNALTRGKDVFDKALRFIDSLNKSSKNPRLKLTMSKYNVHDIEAFYRLALEHGAVPEFAFVSKRGRADANWDEMELAPKEKAAVIKEIERLNHRTGADAYVPMCSTGCPFLITNPSFSFYIRQDGSIFPCQSIFDAAYSLGSIFDFDSQSFQARLDEIIALAKKRTEADFGCRSCFMRSFCNRGCMAAAMICSGNPLGDDGDCKFRRAQYLSRELMMARKGCAIYLDEK